MWRLVIIVFGSVISGVLGLMELGHTIDIDWWCISPLAASIIIAIGDGIGDVFIGGDGIFDTFSDSD